MAQALRELHRRAAASRRRRRIPRDGRAWGAIRSVLRLMSRRAKTLSALNKAPGMFFQAEGERGFVGSAMVCRSRLSAARRSFIDEKEAGEVLLVVLDSGFQDFPLVAAAARRLAMAAAIRQLLRDDVLHASCGVVEGNGLAGVNSRQRGRGTGRGRRGGEKTRRTALSLVAGERDPDCGRCAGEIRGRCVRRAQKKIEMFGERNRPASFRWG